MCEGGGFEWRDVAEFGEGRYGLGGREGGGENCVRGEVENSRENCVGEGGVVCGE